jgi:hypothetical protein
VVTAVEPKAVSTNANRSRVIPNRWREASYGCRREPDNSWQNRRQASTFPARMGNVRTMPDIYFLLSMTINPVLKSLGGFLIDIYLFNYP